LTTLGDWQKIFPKIQASDADVRTVITTQDSKLEPRGELVDFADTKHWIDELRFATRWVLNFHRHACIGPFSTR
jgi:hypothetical protein